SLLVSDRRPRLQRRTDAGQKLRAEASLIGRWRHLHIENGCDSYPPRLVEACWVIAPELLSQHRFAHAGVRVDEAVWHAGALRIGEQLLEQGQTLNRPVERYEPVGTNAANACLIGSECGLAHLRPEVAEIERGRSHDHSSTSRISGGSL